MSRRGRLAPSDYGLKCRNAQTQKRTNAEFCTISLVQYPSGRAREGGNEPSRPMLQSFRVGMYREPNELAFIPTCQVPV